MLIHYVWQLRTVVNSQKKANKNIQQAEELIAGFHHLSLPLTLCIRNMRSFVDLSNI